MKLLFLTDDHFSQNNEDVVPIGGDICYFIAEFHRIMDLIVMCAPIENRKNVSRVSAPWPDNVRFAGLRPYGTRLDYLKRLPVMLAQNVPVLLKEIRNVDMVWLRLPAANGIIAFLVSKILKKPVVVFLVGDADAVSRTNPRYQGSKKWLRGLGAWLDWKFTVIICRDQLTFAYGSKLAKKLQDSGSRDVSVTFTSLVTEQDIIWREDTCKQSVIKILCVGRLSWEKGVDILLDSVPFIQCSDISLQLDIVGDGAAKKTLQVHANRITRNITVNFHGFVWQGPSLDQLFNDSDLFVLPSRSEGIPKVLLKAMAHGLPIVSTSVGGIPNIIQSGENGVLVKPDDPQALGQAIQKIIVHDVFRQNLIQNGYRFVKQHTLSKQRDHIMKVIKDRLPESVSYGTGNHQ